MVNKYFIFIFVIVTSVFSYFAYQPFDVVIAGPVITDQNYFEEELEVFSKQNDLRIKYLSVPDIETYLIENLDNKIDIAIMPNPQGVTNLGEKNIILPIEEVVPKSKIESSFSNHLINVTSSDVTNLNYGVFFRLFPNSLIWYDVKKFEKIGSPEFESFNELLEFTKQNASENSNIWCLDIESGGSTGWVATNWLEDLLIHHYGTEIYDKWYLQELKPSNEEVVYSIIDIGRLVYPNNYVFGGYERVVRKEFRNNFSNLTNQDLSCIFSWSGHYSSYYFPKNLEYGEDFDFMKFPSINNKNAMIGIGDILVATNKKDTTVKVLNHLIDENFGKLWMSKIDATYIPANINNLNKIENPMTKKEQIFVSKALEENMFRYDASELMERKIGSDALWKALKNYIDLGPERAKKEIQDILEELESNY
jgi:alpha-glucoside transport system substrate-binding protein